MEPRAHPRNRDFAWTSPDGARTVLDDEQVRQWDDAGYFLLRDAFTLVEVAAVTVEIDPIQEQVAAFLGTRPGRQGLHRRAGQHHLTAAFLLACGRVGLGAARRPRVA